VKTRAAAIPVLFLFTLLVISGCQQANKPIAIDGSSTVYPISSAMAAAFTKENPGTEITVGYTSTGAGFEKFVAAETSISNASRPIKLAEAEKAAENGVEFIELPVAYDGITVVVNPNNSWVDFLTVEELKLLFSKDSAIKTWQDLREDWPATEVKIFAPDKKSGTYDYFSSAITGKENHRRDYTGNEDDNVLINGVSSEQGAIGYFGFSYYTENKDLVRAVSVDAGNGPVEPTVDSIADGTYTPLSRPIFIYVSRKDAEANQTLKEFVNFYLEKAPSIVAETGYIPLPKELYDIVMKRFNDLVTGSAFDGANTAEKSLHEIISSN
jgi:phosphate transport system substrate-binding protein